MAATSHLVLAPDALITSTRGGRYQATYEVTDSDEDRKITGLAAIILGQANGPDTIPVYGSVFSLTVDGDLNQDLGSFLLDIRARVAGTPNPDVGMKWNKWYVDCTWRAPDEGEYPGEAGVPTLLRPQRVWIEFESKQVEIAQGKNIQALRTGSPNPAGTRLAQRPANTVGPIENAAGTPSGPFYREGTLAVIVVQDNVASYTDALTRNLALEGTTNNAVWLGIPAGQARFLDCRTGEPLYDGTTGTVYFERRTRVEIANARILLDVPNLGHEYVQISGGPEGYILRHERDVDGLPTSGTLALNYLGEPRDTLAEAVIQYDFLGPADYSVIL
jgi:hypothetical protein